jgi:hypothetical protein
MAVAALKKLRNVKNRQGGRWVLVAGGRELLSWDLEFVLLHAAIQDEVVARAAATLDGN